jgi:hypothetical protein
MLQRTDGLNNLKYYIGQCSLSDEAKHIIKKNPHCVEFFCKNTNVINCTKCYNFLNKKVNLFKSKEYKNELSKNNKNNKFCDKHCKSGYIYNFMETETTKDNKYLIDDLKNIENFKYKDFIYTYDKIPYIVNYENTYPKPKTVVHWGQLKMFLTTLLFFMKVIKESDKEVHVIYAGSATGDNILLLCELFPNIKWYLADPRDHNKELYDKSNKKKIMEITKGYFDDNLAKKYADQFLNRNFKLLFMSDIREGTEDDLILDNNESHIRWHKIIKPDYSYFKFRCGYETEENYQYYDGTIYLQIFAPQSSTETRILFEKELKEKTYNIHEFQAKMFYFNRVIRPSYHKSSIKENNMFDHCYDCVYFGYMIKNYISKFKIFKKNN